MSHPATTNFAADPVDYPRVTTAIWLVGDRYLLITFDRNMYGQTFDASWKLVHGGVEYYAVESSTILDGEPEVTLALPLSRSPTLPPGFTYAPGVPELADALGVFLPPITGQAITAEM